MIEMNGLLLACVLPFLGALLLPLISGPRTRTAGFVALGVVLASLASMAWAVPDFLDHPRVISIPWASSIGLSFRLYADGLAALFGLLITGVGAAIFAFAAFYLGPDENRRRFFIFLLAFMGAMLGVIFAGNLISLFVFWELTSVTSFLLIGFWHRREESRDGALKALIVTSSGGLAMLVGFILLGNIAGTFDIDVLLARRDLVGAHPLSGVAAMLIAAGAITKSAQLPFHLWLPSAMEAPTPVSAFLHAATMVKAGLYLVARLGPVLSVTPLWTPLLSWLGLLTMVWCSVLALRQRDLKGVLAFSTVSQLGLILSMLAVSQPQATAAGLFQLLNHGLFKGALFLVVGIIEHQAHTRDLMSLGPLRRQMPWSWAIIALCAMSMAGVPPLGGFISKEMFLTEALNRGPIFAAVALAGAVATAGYCFALAIGLARGRVAEKDSPHAHDPGRALLASPMLLAAGALALGIAPQFFAGDLIEAATRGATGDGHAHVHLALWHGFGAPLALSGVAITGGLGLAMLWWMRREPLPPVLWSDRVYQAFLTFLETRSRRLTDAYMSGLLWRYLSVIFGVAIAGVFSVFFALGIPSFNDWPSRSPKPFEMIVSLAALAAVAGTVFAPTRLAAIMALGASGYCLALLFELLAAPDLALTQIMVETISVALFLATFVFLPPFPAAADRRRFRPGHFCLALTVGIGVAGLMSLLRGHRVAPSISEYYLDNSALLAGGRNVVNVILVDFRGLDTMGEITVLGVTALAAYSLIKLRPERPSDEPATNDGTEATP
ncbi:MAG: multicomponent Na+:H+ antiporter subunit A [Hyphomicrobiaceae bacterium]|jgi:multicomponent Na+:H+ antiporter subunit A